MPTYEYFCQKCEKSFDAVQSMKDPHFDTCPQEKCRLEEWGHGKVKRQLGTGAGLIFKGTGFYITDYRSEGYKEAAKKDVAAPAAAASGESKSSDTPKGDSSKPKSEPSAAPAKKPDSTPAPSKGNAGGSGGAA